MTSIPYVVRLREARHATAGNDYFNLLFPTGAGEGEAALTLAHSQRGAPPDPWPVQSLTGPDGRTLYYLASSIYSSAALTGVLADFAFVAGAINMLWTAPAPLREGADTTIELPSITTALQPSFLQWSGSSASLGRVPPAGAGDWQASLAALAAYSLYILSPDADALEAPFASGTAPDKNGIIWDSGLAQRPASLFEGIAARAIIATAGQATAVGRISVYPHHLHDPNAIIKVGQYRKVGPLSNSHADLRNASSALYDEAAEALRRGSVQQRVYEATLENVDSSIAPGDLITLDHILDDPLGNRSGAPSTRIRGEFVVLEARESDGVDGHLVDVTLSNLDRMPEDGVSMIMSALESLQTYALRPDVVQGAPSSYVYQREVAPALSCFIPVDITDSTLELNRVRLRLKTSPFRSVINPQLAIGAHRHGMFTYRGDTADGGVASATNYWEASNSVRSAASSGYTLPTNLAMKARNTPSVGAVLYTDYTASGAQLDTLYQVIDDDRHPGAISVWVNGVDQTAALFPDDAVTASYTPAPNPNAPPGLLMDFSVTVNGFNADGQYYGGGRGTLASGADVFIEVPNSSTVLQVERASWADHTGETDRVAIGRIRQGPDFAAQKSALSGHSLYLWYQDSSDAWQLLEYDFSDLHSGSDEDKLVWTGGPLRPANIGNGDVIRLIVAEDGESVAVRNYIENPAAQPAPIAVKRLAVPPKPAGTLAEFSFLADPQAGDPGWLWRWEIRGTLLPGSDTDVELPGRTDSIHIGGLYWGRAWDSHPYFGIFRLNRPITVRWETDAHPPLRDNNRSLYLLYNDEAYEFDFSDVSDPNSNSSTIAWGNGYQTQSPNKQVLAGELVSVLIANQDQLSTAKAYMSGTDIPSINLVGDPGLLANLLTDAPGGLHQEHEIEVRCDQGRGRIEATVERWETTQSIIRRG